MKDEGGQWKVITGKWAGGRTRLVVLAVVAMIPALVAPRTDAAASGPTAGGQLGSVDGPLAVDECAAWESDHPEWIFCDDFEDDSPLVRDGRYFEHGDDDGDFVPAMGAGVDGSRGMRTRWQPGEVGAGGLKVAFGRNPNSYMRTGIRPDEDFREIYYRMYLRMQPGWVGNPAKLSRATVFTSGNDWSQAMIAHLWGDREDHLLVDPVRCIDEDSRVMCQGYNDFDHMAWLGYQPGVTPVFGPERAGRWQCVEAHVRLNDPGQSNGLHEFWVDGQLEARRDGLDFVRSYTDYALNAVFFENYWNAGSPREQERYFDNIVISTGPVECLTASPGTQIYVPHALR